MTKLKCVMILLFLPTILLAQQEWVAITFSAKRVGDKYHKGYVDNIWVIPAAKIDTLLPKGPFPMYPFVAGDRNDMIPEVDCCEGVTYYSNLRVYPFSYKESEILRMIKERRKLIQTVKVEWKGRSRQYDLSLKVYATPIRGDLCDCCIESAEPQRSLFYAFDSVSCWEEYWGSPYEAIVEKGNYMFINFAVSNWMSTVYEGELLHPQKKLQEAE